MDYAGRTRVLKGRVAFESALPTTTDVVLSGAALLETSGAAAFYAVKSLTLAGVPAQPGLWGAPGSGASNTSPLLAGTVPLKVQGTADPYEIWSLDIPEQSGRARELDPDGDGLVNVVEYLFGTLPTSGKGTVMTSAVNGTGKLVIRWLERKIG
jgi:hypothetical protein